MALRFTKLTRTNIRTARPGARIAEHGIIFERLANADGRYSINIMVDGERVHRVIGKESDGVTRKQAEDYIQQVRTDARKGRLNLPKGRKTVLGFRKAAQRYLERLAEEGGRDMKAKRLRLGLHLVPFFNDKALRRISSFDVERFKKHRREEGAAVGTVNRELAALSHLLNKAVSWGWIDHRPVKISRFKEESGRITYLTQDQIGRLLHAARQDQNPQIYPFIVVGLETGMRRMEILSIRLENIDIERRRIHIPAAKSGARAQPITEYLAEFLRAYIEGAEPGQEWLFPASKSRNGHTVAIEKPFRRVVSTAGLDSKEVVRHTLRHTAISHLVQAGVDLPTVQRISGHKTLQMVVRYAHQDGNHIGQAMEKLSHRYRAKS